MFTIEHDFDATRVTLIDEGPAPLRGDITIRAHDDRVIVEQTDPASGALRRITFSLSQLDDLRAALHLPEGAYRLEP